MLSLYKTSSCGESLFYAFAKSKNKKSSLVSGLDRGQNDRSVAAFFEALLGGAAAFHEESESIKKLSKVIASNHHGENCRVMFRISSNKAAENFLKCS